MLPVASTCLLIITLNIIPYLIAVSSKLSLSQPTIFSFCASNSPSFCRGEGEEKGEGDGKEEKGERESATWFEVFQWEH